MKKRLFVGVGALLFVMIAITIIQALFKGNASVDNVEYKTDCTPIENRFPDMPDFTECYWKADTIGRTNFGPTNYWIRGFVCLDVEVFQVILNDYDWNPENIVFPKGIDPGITENSNFSWHSNKDFQSMILRQRFVGSVYLDTTNGIIYFDVENN